MIINISPYLSDKSYIQSLPGVINTVVSLDKEAVDRLTDIYQWNMAQVEPDEDLFLFNIIHDILDHSNEGLASNEESDEDIPVSKEDPSASKTTYIAPAASKWEVQVRYFSDRDPYIEVKERSNVGNLGEVVNYELYKVDVEGVCEQNARILGMSIISLQKKFNDLNKVGVNGRISD